MGDMEYHSRDMCIQRQTVGLLGPVDALANAGNLVALARRTRQISLLTCVNVLGECERVPCAQQELSSVDEGPLQVQTDHHPFGDL